jgi:hypothetical protein
VSHTEQTGGDQHLTEITGIAPGTYEAETGDPPRHMLLNANSDMDISLTGGTPTVTVSGTLTLAGREPLPPRMVVSLASIDARRQMAVEADKGRFRFEGVLPGEFTLSSTSGEHALAVVSTSSAGAITAGGHITVGDHALSVDVILTRAQTDIHGYARNGNAPAPGAMIILVPADPHNFPALVRRDQSDSDGSFELLGVAPGTYTILAIQDGWKLDWQDRHALAPYLRAGLSVTLSAQSGPVLRLPRPVPAIPRLPLPASSGAAPRAATSYPQGGNDSL